MFGLRMGTGCYLPPAAADDYGLLLVLPVNLDCLLAKSLGGDLWMVCYC